jgi:hypothetical protein
MHSAASGNFNFYKNVGGTEWWARCGDLEVKGGGGPDQQKDDAYAEACQEIEAECKKKAVPAVAQSSTEAPPSKSNGKWEEIKTHKYKDGHSWFVTNGTTSLNSKPGVLFATEEEARTDARVAIDRTTEAPTKEMIALIRKINTKLKPKGEAINVNVLYGHPEATAGSGRYCRVQLPSGGGMPMTFTIDNNVDPLKVAEELGIAEVVK